MIEIQNTFFTSVMASFNKNQSIRTNVYKQQEYIDISNILMLLDHDTYCFLLVPGTCWQLMNHVILGKRLLKVMEIWHMILFEKTTIWPTCRLQHILFHFTRHTTSKINMLSFVALILAFFAYSAGKWIKQTL